MFMTTSRRLKKKITLQFRWPANIRLQVDPQRSQSTFSDSENVKTVQNRQFGSLKSERRKPTFRFSKSEVGSVRF